jgi:hypothetical protein
LLLLLLVANSSVLLKVDSGSLVVLSTHLLREWERRRSIDKSNLLTKPAASLYYIPGSSRCSGSCSSVAISISVAVAG